LIKIGIVDDQVLLAKSLGYLLEKDDHIRVIAEGSNGLEAIHICETYDLDVLLMDIEMPEMNGIDALIEIKKKHPRLRVMILTTFENPENIMDSYLAGADGYVVKDIAPEDLINAVKCVSNGLKVMHQSVHELIIQEFKVKREQRVEIKSDTFDTTFNTTELDIIRLIAKGMSNRSIAGELAFAEGTIRNKVSVILQKLECKDRTQIALFALKNQLL